MNRTVLAAGRLNRKRARRGPAGDLVALSLTGEDAEGANVYAVLKTYPAGEAVNGWWAKTVKGDDGALFTRISVADVEGALPALVDDAEQGLTDFAIGPVIYKLERDMTERPITEPFEWQFRAQVDSANTYQPEG